MLEGIAVVGMAGKFPGAENIYEYWEKIKQGKQLITRFTEEELRDKGIDEALLTNPNFVPANGLIDSAEFFDSSFFGFTPREADLTDPQHRKFLEACYEALEHSGNAPANTEGSIGVFAGCSMNNYLLKNLLQHPELLESIGEFQTIVNNDKDFLTTKVSYKLNLTGPSYDIQTACSTSLVAVHVACQNLLSYQCDIALGGGAFIMNPRAEGYMYKPGSIESPDGYCRPFDKDASGTLFSEGVGVVVLKRLEDAVRDKDEIWAVIKSSAINNDGIDKVGYMAPGINGQAEVISLAHQFGEIDPRTIGYIEAHGTGTSLGDPIEITALSQVFRQSTNDKNFCAIGSVKGNIGHCDVAAGVAGLIKAVMAIKDKKLPPSINFNEPNPELSIEDSPFYVNTELKDWESDQIRRAAVSSFGIGGTNAHCVLEEWNAEISEPSSREVHLLPLSAKSPEALDKMIANLSDYLAKTPNQLADVAYTLQQGRNVYNHRALVYAKESGSVAKLLSEQSAKAVFKGRPKYDDPATVFMFTGQGSQYINMGKGLYENFELFKSIVDSADEYLQQEFNLSLKDLLFNDPENKEIRSQVNLTSNTQPLLFVIQYATACLLTDFGIYPDALIGHSIGELTAATLSGVFSFEDALYIVAKRGQIMQAQKEGSMLSVNMPAEQIKPMLTEGIELALQNSPGYSVLSGSHADIEAFQAKLKEKDSAIHTTILKTSHAFHSSLMEPALEPFMEVFKDIKLENPEIPFISNVSGTWIDDSEATSPEYWAKHIRSTVQFSTGINTLLNAEKNLLFFEVGPGNTLSMLLTQFDKIKNSTTLQTMRHPLAKDDDLEVFMKSLADFWMLGGIVNWNEIYEGEIRKKVPLPTYPFERKRHWIEAKTRSKAYTATSAKLSDSSDMLEVREKVETDDSSMHERPELASAYVAPSTNTEKLVVAIWEKLLGVKGIGVDDNFFSLGGHSLLASQLMVRINEQFSWKLPLESLFNTPTIRLLLEKYGDTSQKEAEVIQQAIPGDKNEYPISEAQQRLWILNEIEQHNPAYNIPFTYRFQGKLNLEVFRKSLNKLFNRHLVLNSYIHLDEKESVSKILNIEPEVTLVDFTVHSKDERYGKVQEFIRDDTRKPFDIAQGPLYRIYLIKTNSDEFYFHFTIHHIIFDGWSWGIFSRELGELYSAYLGGEEPKLPAPELQYFDYSNWQASHEDIDLDKSIAFWKEQLKGIPTELKFPYDHKRPKVMTGHGAREAIRLSNELSNSLKKISSDENSTLFMTLLTAFGVLMNYYSHDEDICIGAPSANRNKSSFEDIIGFFVNTLVFRLNIDKKLTFKELLQETRKTVFRSLEHQNIPFEKLVEIVQPERHVNVNPIYQVMLAWQNAPREPFSFSGVESERVEMLEGVSPQDITFYLWEEQGHIEGEIEFNTDILERKSIVLLKENFIKLLELLSQDPSGKIDSLSPLAEHSQNFLNNYNKTQVDLPKEPLLHKYIESCVKPNSKKTAVISQGKSLSYAELDAMANQFANYLHDSGIGVGDAVGISMNRNLHMMVALLGILKSGASYLPLDPSFPQERLLYMLDDSAAKLLVTEKSLKSFYEANKIPKVYFDDFSLVEDKPKKLQFTDSPDPDSLAYMIYTSGSTGKPKGVKVHHRAVVNFLQSMARVPGITSNDVLMAVTTLSFDISVLELFLPLSQGASVLLATADESTNSTKFIQLLNEHKVSILQATPATWNMLLDAEWEGNKKLKALCGGEAMSPGLASNLVHIVGELWNMYGPTETTVWSTCYQVTNPENPIYVGKPIDNTSIHILDSKNRKLAANIIGEIAIGGLGVTKGYHNKEELTSEKFIWVDNELIYKTGDFGRIRSDGEIEVYGRIDNQIKLRGFRIEPGEIETQLKSLDKINEAVVSVYKGQGGDERLVAFLTTDVSEHPEPADIKNAIGQYLPAYMVPSGYQFMEAFPRTPNGKIDRKKLVYTSGYAHQITDEVLPTTDTEKYLFELWRKILKTDKLSTNEDFFAQGGNSLQAITMIAQVEKHFECTITFRDFMAEYHTIQKLAEYLDQNAQSGLLDTSELLKHQKRESLFLLQPKGDKIPLFTIFGEQGLLFDEKFFGTDRPVHGFVWPGSDGEKIEMHTVEEIAENYIEQIRKVRPKGPYLLSGFSLGGLIAFEMATRLQKAGEEVAGLVLIDCLNPKIKLVRFPELYMKAKREGGMQKFLYKLRLVTPGPTMVKDVSERVVISLFNAFKIRMPVKLRNRQIVNHIKTLIENYVPGYYKGKTLLLKASYDAIEDEYFGWRTNVDELETEGLYGVHLDTVDLRPNKEIISRRTRSFLGSLLNIDSPSESVISDAKI